ncbi:MAG: hypothetical protein M1834_008815 [Cirrosporium novae-zelandiae]|nr:MAG: hypothetical protein M1834_008815 [Cirrosporium novae-zelandiae]
MAPPTQFACRTLKGLGIVDAAPIYEPLSDRKAIFAAVPTRHVADTSVGHQIKVDASVGNIISTLSVENVYELGFSPRGTFIMTWQRPSKDGNGNMLRNLRLWKVIDASEERSPVYAFFQKSQTGWNLQFTPDESLCARTVTNEVHFYETKDFTTVWNKLRVEGITDFALAPGRNLSVAVFIPEKKGQPASVKIYNIPQFSTPVSQKSFYKCDKIQFKWNDSGTTLLALAQTESDASGKSYFGVTTLYILSAVNDFASRVDFDKEGAVNDVHWSPNSNQFGVVYGFMPAKTTIYNLRAVPVFSFPLGPRNTILFSPHGRFVLVAGFGNLAGQMDIYDLEKDYKKICTIEASNSSVCEWSPDGKYILTATTSPRLRVDNAIRIWHVSGTLMYHQSFDELYQVLWRPESPETHPLEDPFNPVPAPHPSAVAYLGTVKTPSKPAGAYRPPGARGLATPLSFKREDEGGAAFSSNGVSSINGFGRLHKREVPGAEPALPPGPAPGGGVSLTLADGDEKLSKAAAKNKKKREAKKAREAAEKSATLAPPNADGSAPSPKRSNSRSGRRSGSRSRANSNATQRSRSQRRDGGKGTESRPRTRNGPASNNSNNGGPRILTQQQAQPAPDMTVTSPGGGGGTPQDKKIRSLLKKLRAIDDLKMRLAGGEKLEDTQMKKIGTEEMVRKELEGLGWTG